MMVSGTWDLGHGTNGWERDWDMGQMGGIEEWIYWVFVEIQPPSLLQTAIGKCLALLARTNRVFSCCCEKICNNCSKDSSICWLANTRKPNKLVFIQYPFNSPLFPFWIPLYRFQSEHFCPWVGRAARQASSLWWLQGNLKLCWATGADFRVSIISQAVFSFRSGNQTVDGEQNEKARDPVNVWMCVWCNWLVKLKRHFGTARVSCECLCSEVCDCTFWW